eukprot:CAMPEP_0197000712 /NCGR_PEP_ID=MMETSP1380-20130617/5588_1 /TAXON_ID=5936 /ORGANISM="Euplotes crassus, Strain CT5" /LENGTH=459 /DNA_ID=CAMNT_0042418107 /DNA_START=15 /DNA_END=1394 /DNA_ORIENTATION=+
MEKKGLMCYEPHVVSEHLKDRHPYLQKDFDPMIDPEQITHAVHDRFLPKYAEALSNRDLSADRKKDALIKLNQLSTQKDTVDEMINHNMVVIVSTLLLDDDKDVREQAALLIGSFMSHQRARERIEETCPLLKLEDDELKVREATAWTFYQMSLSRHGCDIIVETESAIAIISSFMNFADPKKIREESGKYLIYLLECMSNTTKYDNGIEPLLGKGAVSCLNTILKDEEQIQKLGIYKEKIQQLSLKVVGNICLHDKGKDEAIEEKVILYAWKFLKSDELKTCFNASHVLMSCTLHLDGKKQATFEVDENDNPIILQKIVDKLYSQDEWLRENLKACLINISELPAGFLKITHELSDKFDLIDEVFGVKAIKTLVELLPSLDSYPDPSDIEVKGNEKNFQYVHTINKLFEKYQGEAATVAIGETINFCDQLAPYTNPKFPGHKETEKSIELASNDDYAF